MPTDSTTIQTYSLDEVELLLSRLNDAIVGHAKWLAHWNSNIICDIPVADTHISEQSHKECHFGQWYYQERAQLLQQMPEFAATEALHCAIHTKMSAIVNMFNQGEAITPAQYESFIEAESDFSKAIIELRDRLYKLLLSFDSLTGTLNRQAFFQILEQEHARVTRFNEPCCVILLDIDNFKNINDQFGHTAGDEVLTAIADFIHTHLRPYDSICRYGGEEFLICMPKTSLEVAYTIIDRVRKGLSEEQIYVSDDQYINVPASFGIAMMSAEEVLKDTIEHADKALYIAKANGRNRVEVWAD